MVTLLGALVGAICFCVVAPDLSKHAKADAAISFNEACFKDYQATSASVDVATLDDVATLGALVVSNCAVDQGQRQIKAAAQAFISMPLFTRSAPQIAKGVAPALVGNVRAPGLVANNRASATQMQLFGLGAPELVVIAGAGLLLLGPDQVKELAKNIGKSAAELKEVSTEFNQGLAEAEAAAQQKKEVSGELPPAASTLSPPT
jgi:Sec-independent protein translocase protein TatA